MDCAVHLRRPRPANRTAALVRLVPSKKPYFVEHQVRQYKRGTNGRSFLRCLLGSLDRRVMFQNKYRTFSRVKDFWGIQSLFALNGPKTAFDGQMKDLVKH